MKTLRPIHIAIVRNLLCLGGWVIVLLLCSLPAATIHSLAINGKVGKVMHITISWEGGGLLYLNKTNIKFGKHVVNVLWDKHSKLLIPDTVTNEVQLTLCSPRCVWRDPPVQTGIRGKRAPLPWSQAAVWWSMPVYLLGPKKNEDISGEGEEGEETAAMLTKLEELEEADFCYNRWKGDSKQCSCWKLLRFSFGGLAY